MGMQRFVYFTVSYAFSVLNKLLGTFQWHCC